MSLIKRTECMLGLTNPKFVFGSSSYLQLWFSLINRVGAKTRIYSRRPFTFCLGVTTKARKRTECRSPYQNHMQHSHIQQNPTEREARFINGGVKAKQAEKLLYLSSVLEMWCYIWLPWGMIYSSMMCLPQFNQISWFLSLSLKASMPGHIHG